MVDAVAMREDARFNAVGSPHSNAMHVSERLWLVDADTLNDEIKVEDPKAFARPWTGIKTYHRQPTWELEEYVCADNIRIPSSGGVAQTVLIPKRTSGPSWPSAAHDCEGRRGQ